MSISNSCCPSAESIRTATRVAVFVLYQVAKLHLKIPGGLSQAKYILEVIRTLAPDVPQLDLLQSRILAREGYSNGASLIRGNVEHQEPLAVACEEISVESNSGLRVRLTIDPDILKAYTYDFADNMNGLMKAQKLVYLYGKCLRWMFSQTIHRDLPFTFVIERFSGTSQILEKLKTRDQDLLFQEGTIRSNTYPPQLSEIFNRQWEWFKSDADQAPQGQKKPSMSPLKWIQAEIVLEVLERQSDLNNLVDIARGITNDPTQLLETMLNALESEGSDLGDWEEMFLTQCQHEQPASGEYSPQEFIEKLVEVSNDIVQWIITSIAPELESLPEPIDCSQLERVRLMTRIEIIRQAKKLVYVPR